MHVMCMPARYYVLIREQERELQQAEERRRTEQQKLFEGSGLDPQPPKLRHDFPPLTDGEPVYQKNEGELPRFSLLQVGRSGS